MRVGSTISWANWRVRVRVLMPPANGDDCPIAASTTVGTCSVEGSGVGLGR